MKHCKNCNLDFEDKKVHCPFCGKCIDEQSAKLKYKNHSDIYPDFKIKSNKKVLICKYIRNILFIATIINMAIDLVVNHTLNYSLNVVVAFLFVDLAVLKPIKSNLPIEKFFGPISFFTPFVFLFIELQSKTFGWGLCITVPSFLAAISLTCFILMLAKKFDFDMFSPIILNGVYLTILVILALIFNWFNLIINLTFLFVLFMILLTLVLKFKRATKTIKKDFRF